MKKYLLLVALVALTGCQKDDTIIIIDPPFIPEDRRIYSFLETLGSYSSYELHYQMEDTWLTNEGTNNYFFDESALTGYALLPNYKNSSNSIVYQFTTFNNQFNLERAISSLETDSSGNSSYVPLNSLDTIDSFRFFKNLETLDFHLEDIIYDKENDYYLVTNSKVLDAFCYQTGKRIDFATGLIDAIAFNHDEDYNFLNFRLLNFNDNTLSYEDVSNGSGRVNYLKYGEENKLINKGISQATALIESTSPSLNEMSLLINPTLEYTSKIELIEEKGGSQETELMQTVSTISSSSNINRKVYDNNGNFVSSYDLYKGEDGYAYQIGYNTLNQKVEEKYQNKKFDDLYRLNLDLIDNGAFKKNLDGSYSYIGYQLYNIGLALIDQSLRLNFATFTLNLNDNGIIDSSDLRSTGTYLNDGTFAYYKVTTTYSINTSTPREPEPYTLTDERTTSIVDLLSKDGANYSYSIKDYEEDYLYSYEVTVTEKMIVRMYQTFTIGDNETLIPYNQKRGDGYYASPEGIISFSIDKDEEVTATSPANSSDSIANHLGRNIAPETLEISSDNQELKFKDGVLNIKDGVLTTNIGDSMIESTLKMTLEDLKLKELSFDYSDDYYSGTETITFSYPSETNPIDVEASLKDKIENISTYSAPTSRKEEDSSLYEAFKKRDYTDEEIASIPYLYDEKLTGKWSSFDYPSLYFTVSIDDSAFLTEYVQKYKELLLASGYTQELNTTNIYYNNFIKIAIEKYSSDLDINFYRIS